jgi:branched-chain amino acid transport system substrate-binding protein
MIRWFGFVIFLLLIQTLPVLAAEPITVLDISSYTAGAAFAAPTREGFDMAEEEINVAGGVLGRPIHFEHVDDTGKPEQAITKLQQMIMQEKPVLFTGCNLANIDLAFSAFAKQNKVLQVGACTNGDDASWKEGHDYMFRGTGPMAYALNGMMAERSAQKHKTKWAAINQNYAWGQQNLAAFKENLTRYQPDAQWVTEQWTPIGKIDAGSVVNAILSSGADAVYTSMWGSDLVEFLREAKKRGLSPKALIVGDNLGRPEFIEQMKLEMPEGAITDPVLPLEYPRTPSMKAFAERYEKKYGHSVRYSALQAYLTAAVIVEAIKKAGSTDTDKLITALKGLHFDSIFGPLTMRSIDNVPDNGIWIGESAIKDGKEVFVDVEYKDGKNYYPSDSYIQNLRKQ